MPWSIRSVCPAKALIHDDDDDLLIYRISYMHIIMKIFAPTIVYMLNAYHTFMYVYDTLVKNAL